MNVAVLKPEYIARQMETANLTTTIREKFVSANRTLFQVLRAGITGDTLC